MYCIWNDIKIFGLYYATNEKLGGDTISKSLESCKREVLIKYGEFILDKKLITQEEFNKIIQQINIKYS